MKAMVNEDIRKYNKKDTFYDQLHDKYEDTIRGLKAKKIKQLTDLVSVQRWALEDLMFNDDKPMPDSEKKKMIKMFKDERKLFKQWMAGDKTVSLKESINEARWKKGDKITITTKRGETYTGTVEVASPLVLRTGPKENDVIMKFGRDVKKVVKESVNEAYNLGLDKELEYEKAIGDAIKKLKGIDAYTKTTARYGKTPVNSSANHIYVTQYGKVDNTSKLKSILKKADPNLDVSKLKNNFNASDSARSKHDQDNDIWKYSIPKKMDWHQAKKAGLLKKKPVKKMSHDIVSDLLDMMAQYTSKQHQLAGQQWSSLEDFMQHASDFIKGNNWKKFQASVKKKYPVLESVNEGIPSDMIKSIAGNLAKQGKVKIFMQGKTSTHDTLMNLLNTLPLAKMLKDDDKEKIVKYTMEKFLKHESVNEAKKYKKGDKLKIKLKNGKEFDLTFDAYTSQKGVAFGKFDGDRKPFSLDTVIESVNEGKFKKGQTVKYIVPGTSDKMKTGKITGFKSTRDEDFAVIDGKTISFSHISESVNEAESSSQTIKYLHKLLRKKDADITIKKKAHGQIVYVNGETSFNLDDKGITDNDLRKKALQRAYASSKKNEVNEGTSWPKEVEAYDPDVIFKLVKDMGGKAKYDIVLKKNGKVIEPGGRVYKSLKFLEAEAGDYIIPKGGTQSSQFGESVNEVSTKEYIEHLENIRNDFYNRGLKAKAAKVQADIDKLIKKEESVNESDAYTLHRLANNVGEETAKEFLSKHNIDLKLLAKAISQKTIDKYTLRDIVKGKAHPSHVKKFMKQFVKESVNEAKDKFKVIDTKTGETIEKGLPKQIAQKLAAKKKEWTSYPDREKSAIAKIAMSEESVNEASDKRSHILLKVPERNYYNMVDKLQDMNINHSHESKNVIKVYTDPTSGWPKNERLSQKLEYKLTHDVWVDKFVVKESVNETVKVEVERYKRSHNKNPNGFGSWAFSYNRQGKGHFFTPMPMSYKEAVKWAKEEAKRDGEGYIYVMESVNESKFKKGQTVKYIVPGTSDKMKTGKITDFESTRDEDFAVIDGKTIPFSHISESVNEADHIKFNKDEMATLHSTGKLDKDGHVIEYDDSLEENIIRKLVNEELDNVFNEIQYRPQSGTKAGAIHSLPKKKYQLKKNTLVQLVNEASNPLMKSKEGLKTWWKHSKEDLMSFVYWTQKKIPPSNKSSYDKQWKLIVKQLHDTSPAPISDYKKKMREKIVFYKDDDKKLRRFDTDQSKNT